MGTVVPESTSIGVLMFGRSRDVGDSGEVLAVVGEFLGAVVTGASRASAP